MVSFRMQPKAKNVFHKFRNAGKIFFAPLLGVGCTQHFYKYGEKFVDIIQFTQLHAPVALKLMSCCTLHKDHKINDETQTTGTYLGYDNTTTITSHKV